MKTSEYKSYDELPLFLNAEMVAKVLGMVKNTVIKSIDVLLDARLIAMEHSRYFDQHGMKWKGNNLYTILPTRQAVDTFHQRQLLHLKLDAERRRVRWRQEKYDHRHPRASLCAPAPPYPLKGEKGTSCRRRKPKSSPPG